MPNSSTFSCLVAIVLLLCCGTARAQATEGDFLYRVTTVRATPGDFSDLIDDWKERIANWPESDAARPMWMRHSQGDHWDLIFFFPIVDGTPDLDEGRGWAADPAGNLANDSRAAHVEDLFAYGPPPDRLRPVVESSGYFHIEMFTALPGHRLELLAQRRMENRYLVGIDRPQNFIFRRAAGIAVDAFTLGAYRDLKHFAESADIPLEKEEAAAIEAGFSGVGGISPYLRSLIAWHHDTLAVAIR